MITLRLRGRNPRIVYCTTHKQGIKTKTWWCKIFYRPSAPNVKAAKEYRITRKAKLIAASRTMK